VTTREKAPVRVRRQDVSQTTRHTISFASIPVITPARGLLLLRCKSRRRLSGSRQHITGLEVQDAAQLLAPQEATVPQKTERRKQPAPKEYKNSTPRHSLPRWSTPTR
jgi:hypothetical protein